MEIKEQDIFANSHDEEEVLPVEEKVPSHSVPVDGSVSAVDSPEEDEEPFELKMEEPTVRRKPAPKAAAKPVASKAEVPVSVPVDDSASVVNTPVVNAPVADASSSKSSSPSPKVKLKGLKFKGGGLLWQLFSTFFKIGIVTFGGGYAMIPMIESEVVDKKKWVDKENFLDLIAIAQTCPGVFAINISTFIGYKLRKNTGACLAAFGAALPSFIIILLIATMFRQIQDVPWVAACFRGIRPAVVALIAVPTFNLAKSAKIGINTCWIPIISALLIWALKVNPVFIIIAAALGGYLYGTLIKDK